MIRLPFFRPPPALGLAWSDDHLHVASLSRSPAGVSAGPGARIPLPRAELTLADPASAGTALRQALKDAGISTRPCVAALPSDWVMSAAVNLPDLSTEDLADFVATTAERSFPFPPEDLQIVRSEVTFSSRRQLTLLAARQTSVEKFRQLLLAAGLKPLGLTLGLPLLSEFTSSGGQAQLTLVLEPNRSLLLATADHKVVGLRELDAFSDSASALVRGLRLSWEQFAPDFRSSLSQLQVCGHEDQLDLAQPHLKRWAESAALYLAPLPATDLGVHTAWAIAQLWESKSPQVLQFLPPAPTALERLMARFPRQRLGTLAAIGAAGVLLLLLTLGWQAFTVWRLRDEWTAIQPQVAVTETLQANIRQFRTWSDTTPENLSILRLVSDVFPDTGIVTAKNVDIRDSSTVSVTGTTTDNGALLEILDALSRTPAVSDVKLDQIRGRSPAQFTFKFIWKGAGA